MKGSLLLLALPLIFVSSIVGYDLEYLEDFQNYRALEQLKVIWGNKGLPPSKMLDYAHAVIKTLSKSTILRDKNQVTKLAIILYEGNNEVFIDKNFVSVKAYGESKNFNYHQLIQMLKTMKINKLELMEIIEVPKKLISKSKHLKIDVPFKDGIPLEYGILGLEKVFSFQPESSPVNQELSNLRKIDNYAFNHKFEFESVQIRDFYAIKYLVDQIQINPTSLTETTKAILKNNKYVELPENLNSALYNPEIRIKFKPIFESIGLDALAFKDVFNEALSGGFDEISSLLLENTDPKTVLKIAKPYTPNKIGKRPVKILTTHKYRFGLLIEKPKATEELASNLLMEHKMTKTIAEIGKIKKANPKTNIYFTFRDIKQYLTKLTPTELTFDIDTVKALIDNVPKGKLKNLVIKMTELLPNTIENVELIDHFKKNNVPIQTLAKLAIKYGNIEVLKSVFNQIDVSTEITMRGKLLIELLDTQPMDQISSRDFWKKAEYLMELRALEIPRFKDLNTVKSLKIKPEHQSLRSVKLLMGSENFKTINDLSETSEFQKIVLDLPEEYRKYRRNRVFDKRPTNSISKLTNRNKKPKITMTEIFLKYRGLAELSLEEKLAYKSTIVKALFVDLHNADLTKEQRQNIDKLFRENIVAVNDAAITKEILEKIEKEPIGLPKELSNLLEELQENQLPKNPTGQSLSDENESQLARKSLYSSDDEFLSHALEGEYVRLKPVDDVPLSIDPETNVCMV